MRSLSGFRHRCIISDITLLDCLSTCRANHILKVLYNAIFTLEVEVMSIALRKVIKITTYIYYTFPGDHCQFADDLAFLISTSKLDLICVMQALSKLGIFSSPSIVWTMFNIISFVEAIVCFKLYWMPWKI